MEEEFRLATAGHDGARITCRGGGIVAGGGSRDGLRQGHRVGSGVNVRDESPGRNTRTRDSLTDGNTRDARQDNIVTGRIRIGTCEGSGARDRRTTNHLIVTRAVTEHATRLDSQDIAGTEEGNLRATAEVERVGRRIPSEAIDIIDVEAGIGAGGEQGRGTRIIPHKARGGVIGRKTIVGTARGVRIDAEGEGPTADNTVGQGRSRRSVDTGFRTQTSPVHGRKHDRTAGVASDCGERQGARGADIWIHEGHGRTQTDVQGADANGTLRALTWVVTESTTVEVDRRGGAQTIRDSG